MFHSFTCKNSKTLCLVTSTAPVIAPQMPPPRYNAQQEASFCILLANTPGLNKANKAAARIIPAMHKVICPCFTIRGAGAFVSYSS